MFLKTKLVTCCILMSCVVHNAKATSATEKSEMHWSGFDVGDQGYTIDLSHEPRSLTKESYSQYAGVRKIFMDTSAIDNDKLSSLSFFLGEGLKNLRNIEITGSWTPGLVKSFYFAGLSALRECDLELNTSGTFTLDLGASRRLHRLRIKTSKPVTLKSFDKLSSLEELNIAVEQPLSLIFGPSHTELSKLALKGPITIQGHDEHLKNLEHLDLKLHTQTNFNWSAHRHSLKRLSISPYNHQSEDMTISEKFDDLAGLRVLKFYSNNPQVIAFAKSHKTLEELEVGERVRMTGGGFLVKLQSFGGNFLHNGLSELSEEERGIIPSLYIKNHNLVVEKCEKERAAQEEKRMREEEEEKLRIAQWEASRIEEERLEKENEERTKNASFLTHSTRVEQEEHDL